MPRTRLPLLCVVDKTTSKIVCSLCEHANTFFSRLIGLLGREQLAVGQGMLIIPSSGIHTFGMRFAIDVVSFDQNLKIIGLHPGLPSWRVAGIDSRTHGVLELPAGQIRETQISLGDCLLVHNL